jgi:hypothetical protein
LQIIGFNSGNCNIFFTYQVIFLKYHLPHQPKFYKMKNVLLCAALSICMLNANSSNNVGKPLAFPIYEDPSKVLQLDQDGGKMSAATFKNQEYCRAELKDFDFDAHFDVISAKVYFSGANFRGTEFGSITGNSLKNIHDLKARCIPGSIVTFDEVKVMGPDKKLRTIPGATYILF